MQNLLRYILQGSIVYKKKFYIYLSCTDHALRTHIKPLSYFCVSSSNRGLLAQQSRFSGQFILTKVQNHVVSVFSCPYLYYKLHTSLSHIRKNAGKNLSATIRIQACLEAIWFLLWVSYHQPCPVILRENKLCKLYKQQLSICSIFRNQCKICIPKIYNFICLHRKSRLLERKTSDTTFLKRWAAILREFLLLESRPRESTATNFPVAEKVVWRLHDLNV